METQALKKYLYLLQSRWGKLFQSQVTNIVAYGSGALPQNANKNATLSNILDLLVQVRNPRIFHAELNRISSNDYAGLTSILGPGVLDWSYDSVFPMHSNHIQLQGRKVKYSVIGMRDLREDLLTWKYLSFAGRLHKPVIPLQQFQQNFQRDMTKNRQSALAVALLLIRRAKDYPLNELFARICEISYKGDVRFSAGVENPRKVYNIVDNNYFGFYNIYFPLIKNLNAQTKDISCQGSNFSFQLTPPTLALLVPMLPKELIEHLKKLYGQDEDLIKQILLAGVGDLSKDLISFIKKKNRWSSIKMASENFLTASPINNLEYLLTKLSKKK